MDNQRVVCLGLLYGEPPAVLQLGAVQKPGSNHGGGQFDGEASVFALHNLTALEATVNFGPRN